MMGQGEGGKPYSNLISRTNQASDRFHIRVIKNYVRFDTLLIDILGKWPRLRGPNNMIMGGIRASKPDSPNIQFMRKNLLMETRPQALGLGSNVLCVGTLTLGSSKYGLS